MGLAQTSTFTGAHGASGSSLSGQQWNWGGWSEVRDAMQLVSDIWNNRLKAAPPPMVVKALPTPSDEELAFEFDMPALPLDFKRGAR